MCTASETARRTPERADGLLVLRLVLVYVVVRVADALNLLGVLVRDFDAELLLEAHHELHGVERVRAEVVNEARVRRDLVLVNAQLVNDDLLHFCFNLRIGHYSCSSSSKVGKLENCKTPLTGKRKRRSTKSHETTRRKTHEQDSCLFRVASCDFVDHLLPCAGVVRFCLVSSGPLARPRLRERRERRLKARSALHVQAARLRRGLPHEPAQNFSRPDFDERRDALARQKLDRLAPAHGRRDLPDERVARLRARAYDGGVYVRHERHAQITELYLF